MKLMPTYVRLALAAMLSGCGAVGANAQSNEDLAKKPSNQITSLISVAFQFSYDHGSARQMVQTDSSSGLR